MNSRIIKILFVILFLNFNLFAHDFHMSYGESVLTAKEFKGKITFYKVDFFKALKTLNGTGFENFNSKKFTELKQKYLSEHLNVLINNRCKPQLIITNSSEDGSSIWFSFSFKSEEEIKSIKIFHSALY